MIDTAIDDKKLQKDLKSAGREPARRVRAACAARQKSATGAGCSCIAIVGAVLAIALSEDLRKAVLDKLFGAEEEFEYTSTTTPAPAPAATEG